MITEYYSKHWDNENGFTMEEAMRKKEDMDSFYEVNNPKSRWNPAVIRIDPGKKSGYQIVMTTRDI